MWLYPVPAVLTILDGRGFFGRRVRRGNGDARDWRWGAGVLIWAWEKKQWPFAQDKPFEKQVTR